MIEIVESLLFAGLMVPIMTGLMLGLVYILGSIFNVFSMLGHSQH